MPIKSMTPLGTPGVNTNFGQELKEQNQNRADTDAANRALREQGITFDPTTQVVNRSGLAGAQRSWEKYVAENPAALTAIGGVKQTVNLYTPRVRVNDAGDGLVLSGSKEALESGLAKELRTYLADALRYQDLSSANVAEIINALNTDLADQIERSVVENGLGADYDAYKDYSHALEVMSATNPLRKTGESSKILGLLKDGTTAYKTPNDWLEYYRKEYNTEERAKLFADSMKTFGGTDFSAQTPYLVMSGGRMGDTPIYGFDFGEALKGGATKALSEFGKFPEGVAQGASAGLQNLARFIVNADGFRRRDNLKSIGKAIGVNVTSKNAKWLSEEDYNQMVDSVTGKKLNQMTEKEKAFLAAAISDNYFDNPVSSQVERFLTDDNGVVDENFLQAASYENYLNARDNLATTEEYDREMDKPKGAAKEAISRPRERLQPTIEAAEIYAPVSVMGGNFVGTMARYVAEALTGAKVIGVNPAAIGDALLGKVATVAAKHAGTSLTAQGITAALQAPLGRFLLGVATEVPEDIVQTAIDNVITGRAEENASLLTPESLAENTLQNLIFRGIFSLGRQGVKTVAHINAIRKAAQDSGLNATIDVEKYIQDASELKQAFDTGNVTGATADGKIKIRGADGVEKVLDNTYVLSFRNMDDAPELAEMAKRFSPPEADVTVEAVERARKAIENGEYDNTIKVWDAEETDAYQRWAEQRRAFVDESYDLGPSRTRAEWEKVFEEKNPAPLRYLSDDAGKKTSIELYKSADDGFTFRADPTSLPVWRGITTAEIAPEKLLTKKQAERIFLEASKVGERGDEALKAFAAQYSVTPQTVLDAATGHPEALARLSGKAVVEGGAFTNGLSDGEYRYVAGVDADLDRIMSNSLLASTGLDAEADVANVKMANTLQDALDNSPYDKTVPEIVSEKYKTTDLDAAPNTASPQWNTPPIDGAYESITHAMAAQPNGLSLPEVQEWVAKTRATFEQQIQQEVAPQLDAAYPTTSDKETFVRNMHFLFDTQVMDKTPLEATIGKTFTDIDGAELRIRQEDVDFYNNVLEPVMRPLREAGAAGQGITPEALEGRAITGYLPHTTYNPFLMTGEEALQQGNLWKRYKGASASIDGNFTTTTLSPDLYGSLRVFSDNMIWDSLGDKAIVAKMMQELHADGVETSGESVRRALSGERAVARAVEKTQAAKNITKALTSDNSDIDFKALQDSIVDAEKRVGATRALSEAYAPIYGKATGEYSSPRLVAVQQTSDIMRGIITPDGSMYDNGGRMVLAGDADAKFLANRIFDENQTAAETRAMLVDYLSQFGRRTTGGAEHIADQWMMKILQESQGDKLTKRALVSRLNSLIYFEGSSRLKRFVGRADLSRLSSGATKWMDGFFLRQGLLSRQLGDSTVMAKINKVTNRLISARMKSVFWLNYKNAVLQASECIRLFTEFKIGDALQTIQKMAGDKEFKTLVETWVDILVPDRDFSKSAEAIDITADIAKKSSIVDGDITVNKMSGGELSALGKKMDDAAMSPINFGENLKNEVLVAGILQEAQRKGLEGDALFNYMNSRFERIGLANNAMGRLGGADNPFFRIATNLKSFGIRQAAMYINNIHDMNGGQAIGYILKNLGWKVGLATLMAKLGYSPIQSMGVDPLGILEEDYTGVDEENYNPLDQVVAGPVGRLLLSGGFTSFLAQAYWGARQTYEGQIATPAEEVDRKFQDREFFELAMPSPNELFENMLKFGAGFIPGYTQGDRVIKMADLMAKGWATSSTGNLTYAAPTDALNTIAGYVLGRSSTENARTYNQTPDPLQGLIENGLPGFVQQFARGGAGFREFDPVDKENYSDWFYGDTRDDQQWNAGYYYFREQANKILEEYQRGLRDSYSEETQNAVYNSYNARLRELDDSIKRFVQAYQAKNPGKFDANKMNNILTVMRLYQPDLNADELTRSEQFFDANDMALQRYTAAGLPQRISYRFKDGKTETVASPQLQAALQGKYGLPEEASRLIKQVYNDKWKDLNKQYRDRYYSTKTSKEKKAIQAEYFNLVRQDLDPIVALYGASIFSNDAVDDVMEDVFNSMTPYGTTVKKYLQGKYADYMAGTIRYSQPGSQTITEIRNLLDQGKTARGKALARALLQRVQENRQPLTRDELEWLQGVLNE